MKSLAVLVLVCAALVAETASAAVPLVSHADSWQYRRGTNAPQPDWKTVSETSLDSSWSAGAGGFGYADNTAETANCKTLLPDMLGHFTCLYTRKTFTTDSMFPTNQHLFLQTDWDDGFIAWLDGRYLTNMNVAAAPAEPGFNATASAGHESSLGNNNPQAPVVCDLGPASGWLPPGPHILAVMGLNQSAGSSDFILVADLYADSAPVPPTPQTNVWHAADSPFQITTNVNLANGSVLVIEPGTIVQFGSGIGITVNDGQLLAAGTAAQRIRFTRLPGGGSWAGFQFVNSHASNVLTYADMEYGDSRSPAIYIRNSQVTVDRMTFFHMSHKYFDIWEPQVIIRHSTFGDLGGEYFATVEHMLPDGWFIVDGNLFGRDTGDNDIFHLNRVSVKGGPVAQILNNVFTGAGDDIIDDNETDTHIEGNLFLNFTTNHPPRSASAAVTTGEGGSTGTQNLMTQHLTVVRNIFWGNDYGILNKDGSYVQVFNCVFVGNRGAIIFDEPWRTNSGTTYSGPGRACYIENSIFWNNWPDNGTDEGTFAFLHNPWAYRQAAQYRGATQVTVNHSLLPAQFHNLGVGNLDAVPLFVAPTNNLSISPTNPAFATGFDGFEANEFLITNRLVPDVHLQAGSPALGTGFNGADLGFYTSDDATIQGEPDSAATSSEIALTVGGLDIAGYKFRLVTPAFTNAWSPERQTLRPVSQILLSGTTATATVPNHDYTNGDVVEMLGADSLAPYFNGQFTITNVTASTFEYDVVIGTNAIMNELPPRDLWCRRPEKILLTDLTNGVYWVDVVRKNTLGVWQSTEAPTISKRWTIGLVPPKVSGWRAEAGQFLLTFDAAPGQTYSVLRSESLAPAAWTKVSDIAPGDTVRSIEISDPMMLESRARFYRLITPALP